MSKPKPEDLLAKFLENAALESGMIDPATLDFRHFHEILKQQHYDEGIDHDMMWQVCLGALFKIHDSQNPDRVLAKQEKQEAVVRIHDFLSNVPYVYQFYFCLPDGYEATSEVLSSEIEIIETDQAFVDKQELMNPPSRLDELMGAIAQDENHRLLKAGKKYLLIHDKGLVLSGRMAFLESRYSPDRLFGIFLGLHLVIGTLSTDKSARDNTPPHVYDSTGKYRANFASPVKASKAEHLQFKGEAADLRTINTAFMALIKPNSDKVEEAARVQICNSIYWYMEFLNTEEDSLRIVFLISALDSLFPPRPHTVFKGKQIVPTVLEKAPVIAEVCAKTQKENQLYLETIENLFEERNKVIHGKVEIHGYSKSSKKQNAQNHELIETAQVIYETYLANRIEKYNQ